MERSNVSLPTHQTQEASTYKIFMKATTASKKFSPHIMHLPFYHELTSDEVTQSNNERHRLPRTCTTVFVGQKGYKEKCSYQCTIYRNIN